MPQLQNVIRKDKKVVIAEHNRCQKNILKFYESIANAGVEVDQEIFNEGKF